MKHLEDQALHPASGRSRSSRGGIGPAGFAETAALAFVSVVMVVLGLAAPGLGAGGVGIGGRVLDADGKPVEGARVWLEEPEGRWRADERALRGEERPAVDDTVTGPSGEYSLEAPEPGLWWVRVSAPGFGSRMARLEPLLEPATLPDLRLRPGYRLEVSVVDAEGQPAPDLRVLTLPSSLWVARRGSDALWQRTADQGRTDARGKVRLTLADEVRGRSRTGRGRSGVVVLVPGGVPLWDTDPVSAGAAGKVRPVGFRLPSYGDEAEIRVLDVGGKRPVAGAIVSWYGRGLSHSLGRTGEGGILRLPWTGEGEQLASLGARTEDGRNARGGLVAGSEAPTSAARGSEVSQAGVEARAPSRIELRLEPAPRLAGRALDADTREGIAGAWVWIRQMAGEKARTDTSGGFELAAPRDWAMMAAAPGYRYLRSEDRFGPAKESSAGEEEEVLLLLDPVRTIRGRVVDRDGEGIPGAGIRGAVDLSSVEHGAAALSGIHRHRPATVSGADGSFRLQGLVVDLAYRLHVSRRGFGPAFVDVPPSSDAEPQELEIRLETGLIAFGRVIGRDEQPIAGARVELLAEPAAGDFRAIAIRRELTG
ncbi:MAG: carboxypeptidase-like regulatory domain-containing protein, partial [Holophagales bacterium]|nr:carboxypeptidase-like regulatory domain-containing protein [Holophagales bacterium]